MTLMTKRHWILKSNELPSDESYHRALCPSTIAHAFCIKLELSRVQKRFSTLPPIYLADNALQGSCRIILHSRLNSIRDHVSADLDTRVRYIYIYVYICI
jgi:hypothetical protein